MLNARRGPLLDNNLVNPRALLGRDVDRNVSTRGGCPLSRRLRTIAAPGPAVILDAPRAAVVPCTAFVVADVAAPNRALVAGAVWFALLLFGRAPGTVVSRYRQ